MNAYTIENLSETDGVCGATESEEVNLHDDYYNIRVEWVSAIDKTHPNYRGYGKIAEGMITLVEHLLDGKDAPKYMIDIG